MERPIAKMFFGMASVMIVLWANHDFIDGSYSGPDWFKNTDFILTQVMVACIIRLLWKGHQADGGVLEYEGVKVSLAVEEKEDADAR